MIKINANRSPWSNKIELLVFERTGKRLAVGTTVNMEVVDEGLIVEPTLRIEMTEAQELMDSLWHCGLRPSEGSGSAGSLAATERHLADMQKIAFKVIDKAIGE